MNLVLDHAMRNYGVQVKLTRGSRSWKTRGFFQTMGEGLYNRVQTSLGEQPGGKYTFIGQLSPLMATGDTLTLDGKNYLVKKAEIVYDGKGPAYQLCGCVRKGTA